jgi:hypothetical protein
MSFKILGDISPSHPVIGAPFYRKLEDDDILQESDETACVSCLLSESGEYWRSIMPDWADCVGTSVASALDKDADSRERIFRRKVETLVALVGGPRSGYQVWGPFFDVDEATKWAEERKHFIGWTTIMEVGSPKNHPVRVQKLES